MLKEAIANKTCKISYEFEINDLIWYQDPMEKAVTIRTYKIERKIIYNKFYIKYRHKNNMHVPTSHLASDVFQTKQENVSGYIKSHYLNTAEQSNVSLGTPWIVNKRAIKIPNKYISNKLNDYVLY